jgi:hypothetical protein
MILQLNIYLLIISNELSINQINIIMQYDNNNFINLRLFFFFFVSLFNIHDITIEYYTF